MSNLIQTARRETDVSNAELARRLGVTPGAVSQLERSEREGSIRWETLERALRALDRSPRITMSGRATPRYGAQAVTDSINRALDADDETLALRLLTRAAQAVVAQSGLREADLLDRPWRLKSERWETLFGALYGGALPLHHKPAWAQPKPLKWPWFVSRFEPLRERAKTSTPQQLRELNIFIDAKSLERA